MNTFQQLGLEDHLLQGGFNKWISEQVPYDMRPKLRHLALDKDIMNSVGSREFLLNKHGLSINDFFNFIKEDNNRWD